MRNPIDSAPEGKPRKGAALAVAQRSKTIDVKDDESSGRRLRLWRAAFYWVALLGRHRSSGDRMVNNAVSFALMCAGNGSRGSWIVLVSSLSIKSVKEEAGRITSVDCARISRLAFFFGPWRRSFAPLAAKIESSFSSRSSVDGCKWFAVQRGRWRFACARAVTHTHADTHTDTRIDTQSRGQKIINFAGFPWMMCPEANLTIWNTASLKCLGQQCCTNSIWIPFSFCFPTIRPFFYRRITPPRVALSPFHFIIECGKRPLETAVAPPAPAIEFAFFPFAEGESDSLENVSPTVRLSRPTELHYRRFLYIFIGDRFDSGLYFLTGSFFKKYWFLLSTRRLFSRGKPSICVTTVSGFVSVIMLAAGKFTTISQSLSHFQKLWRIVLKFLVEKCFLNCLNVLRWIDGHYLIFASFWILDVAFQCESDRVMFAVPQDRQQSSGSHHHFTLQVLASNESTV